MARGNRKNQRSTLSRDDFRLGLAAFGGVCLLILVVAILPSGKFSSLFQQSAPEEDSSLPSSNQGGDTRGVFNFGQSLVTLNQLGAYLQFDMSIEYEPSAAEGEIEGLNSSKKREMSKLFESVRGKIDDAIIMETSRHTSEEMTDPNAVDELKEELAFSINKTIKRQDVAISNVYFTSFVLVPPEEAEDTAS